MFGGGALPLNTSAILSERRLRLNYFLVTPKHSIWATVRGKTEREKYSHSDENRDLEDVKEPLPSARSTPNCEPLESGSISLHRGFGLR